MKIDPKISAPKIAASTSNTLGRSGSAETVRRVLRKAGYNGRVARRKPLIGKRNRVKRLKFTKEHILKPQQFWNEVIFGDESKFNIFGSDGRRMVRRKPNTSHHPKHTTPTVKHGGGTGMQDNDSKHTAFVVKEWLLYHCRNQLNTPPQFPDLNVIENLWPHLERAVQKHQITSKEQLKSVLQEELLNIAPRPLDILWNRCLGDWKLSYQQKRQFQTTGTAIRGFSSGRPRGTTPADDRYIVLQARRNRRQTAGEIARHTTQATGRPISRFTVARRLHGGGLFARRPVRCVPLTPAHRRRRSLWCREHRNWRDNEWGRVLFTDESRFSLSSDSHRILIWRELGEAAIIPRTSLKGTGTVNGTHYCNEILLPYMRLFRGAMGLQFLFMDDNAPCHRTVAAEQLLESEDIERMDWPARSPDLNLIEHVWDFLGRRLAARTLPPVTIR
ncbi:transposable element Tcb2 transposase [Trichonephila clavipes]|nr:transposable element Tcb2 transposase [Trichonephila clavipes]